MKSAAIYLILLAIVIIGIAIADNKSAPDGTIYGHVYDAQTKQPVSGAFVYCQEAKCPKQLTDDDGYYAIENCFSPSSNYVIECTKNGYPTAKNTAQTDSCGKAEVDFTLGNTPSPSPEPESNPTQAKSWRKTFGGPGIESGSSVQQTSDGGYIVVGSTASRDSGISHVWLIKADADGNKLWDRTFGGSGEDKGYSVQQTSDGGYIIAGSTGAFGANDPDISLIKTDILLIKTDSNGNKLWDRSFGRSYNANGNPSEQTIQSAEPHLRTMSVEYEWPALVQQASDGGYIVVGQTKSSGKGNSDICLIKTDSEGNKQWDSIFGSFGSDEGRSILQSSDGGYIIAGSAESYGAWLIKTDSQGRKEWDKTFGVEFKGASLIQQTNDDGYIIAGLTGSFGAWLIKVDPHGNELWNRSFKGFGVTKGEGLRLIQRTKDGNYIIVGEKDSYGVNNIFNGLGPNMIIGSNIWLIKADSDGNKQWERTFGGLGYNGAYSIQQTKDGGYILVGQTYSGSNGTDIWLIKTDSEGN